MRHATLSCIMAAAVMLAAAAVAQTKKPPLPPGRDPGGVAIALLGTGIDYVLPEIAQRLARDGEGELIGWNLVDNDNRPFARGAGGAGAPGWGGDGTALARAVGAVGRRIVPVKINPADPRSLARAVAFVAETPARIVVVPAWSRQQGDWEAFREAALHFRGLLFIVAAGDEGTDIDREPVWPAAFGLTNVLVVSAPVTAAGDPANAPNTGARTIDALVAPETGGETRPPMHTSLAAVLVADALAGCWPRLAAAHRGEALKKALLAEAGRASPGSAKPIIARCPGDSASTPKR
jgi:hypothetical protein